MNKTPEELADKYASKFFLMGDSDYIMTMNRDAFLAGYAAAQTNLPTPAKWISVKEKLPEPLESVLVIYAPTNQAKNDYRMECWNWPETEVYEKKFITHWMPLPELPKENE